VVARGNAREEDSRESRCILVPRVLLVLREKVVQDEMKCGAVLTTRKHRRTRLNE